MATCPCCDPPHLVPRHALRCDVCAARIYSQSDLRFLQALRIDSEQINEVEQVRQAEQDKWDRHHDGH